MNVLCLLLSKYGNEVNLNIILFILDEIIYVREFVFFVGYYFCFKLGLVWWFYDSLEGMLCFCY